jgi:hypothetical protein
MPNTTFRRSRAVLAATFAAAFLTVAALTGCTGPSHPSGAISPLPRPHLTSAPAPAPTAAGTASTFCDRIVQLTAVRAALTSTAVTAQPYYLSDEDESPRLSHTAVPLLGGVQCLWQDRSVDPTYRLNIEVLPNASAAFVADSASLESADDGHGDVSLPNIPLYGDASYTQCLNIDDPWYGDCAFNIRVGNYWVVVDTLNHDLAAPYPESSAVAALLNSIISFVRSLPANPVPPHPTAESLTLPTSCDRVLPLASLRTAVGEPTLVDTPWEGPGAYRGGLDDAASTAAHELSCFWIADDGRLLSIDLIPGSAVAWGTGPAPSGTAETGLTALSGLGRAAYQRCTTDASNSQCQADVLVANTWFQLTEDNSTAVSATAFDSLAHQIVTAMGYRS